MPARELFDQNKFEEAARSQHLVRLLASPTAEIQKIFTGPTHPQTEVYSTFIPPFFLHLCLIQIKPTAPQTMWG